MSATLPPVHTDAVRRPRRSLRFVRDEELVRLCRAGDECAFEAIYDRHSRGILSFCRHMLGSREEAEDAVQHTFASAYRDLVASTKPIQLKAWLYTIARNRSLSILRARREERALDDVAEPSVEGLATQVQRRQDLRDMLADLQRLPEDQRAALVLAELGALSHDEIAVTLDVRKEKVKALVFQARESLASSRQARDADCREIQEQLSVLRGGSLRRTELRRHVAVCPACSAFKAEVQRQRAAMAIVLPVTPTLALKQSALGAAAAAAGSGSGAIGGGAGGGLLSAVGAKTLAAKVIAIATVAGGATGGGLMAVDELSTAPADDSRPALVAPRADTSVRMVESLRADAARTAIRRSAERPATGRAGAPAADERDGDRGGSSDRPRARREARAKRRRGGRVGSAGVPAPAQPAVTRPESAPEGNGRPAEKGGNGNGNPSPGTPRRGTVGNSPSTPPGQTTKGTANRAGRRAAPTGRSGAPGQLKKGAPSSTAAPDDAGNGNGQGDAKEKLKGAASEVVDTLPPQAIDPVRDAPPAPRHRS